MRILGAIFAYGLMAAVLTSTGVSAATPHSEFIGYPAFTKRPSQIDVYEDKGLVVELVINCGQGRFGIVTLSKVEGVFCGPDGRCVDTLDTAIGRLCK